MQFKQLSTQRQAQRGGTMLGIIFGVLLGLGAALAVAVYVTKVPVPWVNKSTNRGTGTEQDAAEAKKNSGWDPNAPLYGKNPAKPNPAIAAPAATEPATGTASAAVSSKPGASAAGKGKPTSTDPLGDLAKAKAAAAAPGGSTIAGADPFTYLVQAGAFRTPEDAEGQRAKLAMMGMDAKVSEREQSGRTVYRVRLGPFNNKEAAESAKEKLDGNGFETALVRVQR